MPLTLQLSISMPIILVTSTALQLLTDGGLGLDTLVRGG
jgi:hypothetical protein